MGADVTRTGVDAEQLPRAVRPLLHPDYRAVLESVLDPNAIPRPSYLTVDLTHRCNANCRDCVEHLAMTYSGRTDLTTEVLLDLIDASSQFGVRAYGLYGGEPLMHPGLPEVLDALRERSMKVDIVTNGFLLCVPRIAEAVVRAHRSATLRSVRVSLNAGSAMVHSDHFRVTPHHFAHVVAGARDLVDAGVPLWVSYLVTERNHHDLPSAGQVVFDQVGADLMFVRPKTGLHGIGLAEFNDELRRELNGNVTELSQRYPGRVAVVQWYSEYLDHGALPATEKSYRSCPFAAGLRAVISPPSPGQIWSCSYWRGDPRFAAGSLEQGYGGWVHSEERRRAYERVNPIRDCADVICNKSAACAVIQRWRREYIRSGSLPQVAETSTALAWG